MGTNKLYSILILCFVFCVFNLNAQNKTDANGRKQGPWVKYYPESKIPQYRGQFVDDKPVGEFYYFHPTGEVRAIIEHIPNSLRSYATYYHKNKEVMSEGAFWNQKKDSVWTHFDAEGLITEVEEYKNDLLNGRKQTFFIETQRESGKLQVLTISYYKDNQLHGDFKEFFSNGKLKKQGKFELGNKVGEWVEYNLNGQLVGKVRYKNGLVHGWAYGYDANGKVIKETLYVDGVLLEGKDKETYLNFCKKKGIDPNQ